MALEQKKIIIHNDSPAPVSDEPLEYPRDVYIAMVLDSSGSMIGLTAQVIESFNAFVTEQAAVPAETIATLCDFNSVVTFPSLNVDMDSISHLTPSTYRPQGSTALYDAIMETKDRVEAYLNDHPGLNVLFSIITDGEENASATYNRQQVFDMIREKTEQGWVFTYLSADADAFANAMSIGITGDYTIQWASTPDAYSALTLTSSLATTNYRYSRDASFNLSSAADAVISASNLDSSALKVGTDSSTLKVGTDKTTTSKEEKS